MSRSSRNRAAQRSTTPVKGSVKRTVIRSETARMQSTTVIHPRHDTGTAPIRHGRRAGQDKGQGLWRSVSQNYMTPVTIDARWSDPQPSLSGTAYMRGI